MDNYHEVRSVCEKIFSDLAEAKRKAITMSKWVGLTQEEADVLDVKVCTGANLPYSIQQEHLLKLYTKAVLMCQQVLASKILAQVQNEERATTHSGDLTGVYLEPDELMEMGFMSAGESNFVSLARLSKMLEG